MTRIKELTDEQYLDLWARVVRDDLHLGRIVDLRPPTRDEDWLQATDMVMSIPGGDVALRLRDYSYYERFGPQWSIRVFARGHRTEIHKIRDDGWARWYLFGYYHEPTGTIGYWFMLDLDAVREAGILDGIGDADYRPNGDGTGGYYIPLDRLMTEGCVIECSEPIEYQAKLI